MDPYPLPDGWSIAELRDKQMNRMPGGHRRTGSAPVPTDRVDATDEQLAKSWKVLLRYDPPGHRKPKYRTLIRANSRRKVARGIETIIADSSPV